MNNVQAMDGRLMLATEVETQFKEIAGRIAADTIALGERWLRLCIFIRKEQVTKRDATKWLLELGFHKGAASQVCKVAMCANAIFSKYEARLIGWRGALQLSRGNLDEVKRAMVVYDPELVEVVEETVRRDEELAAQAEETIRMEHEGMTADEIAKEEVTAKRFSQNLRMKAAVVSLLAACKAAGVKSHTWISENGKLTITVKVSSRRI
jgi:hypothetical protein